MFRFVAWPTSSIIIGVAFLGLLTACAGRNITTSVEDQTFVPSRPTQAIAPSPEEPKPMPIASTAPEPPLAEPQAVMPVAALPAIEPANADVSPGPSSEEERIAAPVIATAPPGVPQLPPAPPPTIHTIALSDVYFDFDQFLIRRDATDALQANATRLKTDAALHVLIEGHCDERGSVAYNLVLGERRAKAVKQYLQDLGIPASQLTITSYGKDRPFCTEHSEACYQSNRRAHFSGQ
jgi:peptidoglycan-associated lipoprotein